MVMKVYLVQHGESEPEEVNPARPLSARGRQQAQSVAALAARLKLDVYQIRHSGKTRAADTASILGEALSPRGGIVAVSGLNPNDDVGPIADVLTQEKQTLMLVGHLPFLSRLAGLLVAGNPDVPVIKFQYAAINCLEREQDKWQVAWIVTPEIAEIAERR
jgi:phosphohistidine phosphatase